MARILIEAGLLKFERLAANAKADRLLTAAAVARGYAGDIADKAAILDFIGGQVIEVLRGWALDSTTKTEVDAAVAEVRVDPPDWSQ